MNAGKIYAKTMKFVWLKLGLGAAITGISLVLLALVVWIASLFKDAGVMIWAGVLWFCLTYGIYQFINRYFGYMIKAAHIAVITETVTTGKVPENMVETGKEMVKKRFVTSNVYFVLDSLISGAVKQLQNAVGKIDNIFGEIPGVSAIVNILQLFIGIALGYIDECCLGYTFYKKEQGAFKSGCDGVVVYFQNAKHLLKSAAMTTLVVVVLTFLAWVIPFAVISGIFAGLNVHWYFAFIIAAIIASAIKSAFIDSYMMIRTMVSYMQVAPSTVPAVDVYGKLCKISNKFKKLFTKAEQENTATA